LKCILQRQHDKIQTVLMSSKIEEMRVGYFLLLCIFLSLLLLAILDYANRTLTLQIFTPTRSKFLRSLQQSEWSPPFGVVSLARCREC